MSSDREQEIRERAYALWEQEGRPEGDDLRHWIAALQEFGAEGPDQATVTENTSVLGTDETASGDATKAKAVQSKSGSDKRGKSAKVARSSAPRITTGQEPASKAFRHTEGP